MAKKKTTNEKNNDNIILSIQNASYQYSDATSDEYAIKDINYDFEKGREREREEYNRHNKKLYFRVPDGENPRQYNDLDVYSHPNFPQKDSALPQDPRYKFTGNASVEHDLDDGHFFKAELEYSTGAANAKDIYGQAVTGDTKPWKLAPDNVDFSYPEMNVPFRAAYDGNGRRFDSTNNYRALVPVVNSAGTPILIERAIRNVQMSFSFATKKWDPNYSLRYGGTINSKAIKICGVAMPEKKALMLAPECSYITTYEDNSSNIKWQYWNVRVTILIDVTGQILQRRVLDIGDYAVFPGIIYSDDLLSSTITLGGSNGQASRICRFRKYKRYAIGSQYAFAPLGDDVICSWEQFLSFRQAAISASFSLKSSDPNYCGDILDPQCEQLSQIPLLATGYVDRNAMQTGVYRTKIFRMYPPKDWSAMNLPQEGAKW